MIRRTDGSDWLLISQVEHARLAARIAEGWGNEAVPVLPVSGRLVRAVELHDDGWFDWEREPDREPEQGRPRDFTEMPMAEAAAIWTRSIEIATRGEPRHVVPMGRLRRHLGTNQLAPDQSAILRAVLDRSSRFTIESIVAVVADVKVPMATIESTLDGLVNSNVLATHEPSPLHGEMTYEVISSAGVTPLEGSWVSRHFARLAEQARENRDDPADVVAAERFLAEQEEHRSTLRPTIELFAGENTDRLVDGGYRLLRYFDWMSLWMCIAERSEGTDMAMPGGPSIRFEPAGANTFRLSPWPLSVPAPFRVTARAVRVPASTDPVDPSTSVLDGGVVETLAWTLVD